MENKFIGQTALIIAAGPSLNENIEKIKANRDKFVIFAVNKVLRVLEANGITPDFVVCLDASGISATLTGLEDFCSKINCISDLKSDISLLTKTFKKHFITFSKSEVIVNKLANYNKFVKMAEYGGSATTMALVVAHQLGFSKIIFAGLDLAFKNDIMYATGEAIQQTPSGQIVTSNITKNISRIKSVTGEVVKTRDDYAAFINHFEVLIKDLAIKEASKAHMIDFETLDKNYSKKSEDILLNGRILTFAYIKDLISRAHFLSAEKYLEIRKNPAEYANLQAKEEALLKMFQE